MNRDFAGVSMETALAFLKEHSGQVFFMTEKGVDIYYQGKKLVEQNQLNRTSKNGQWTKSPLM